MYWLISPPDRTSWHIPRGDLIDLLKRDWPELVVAGPDPGPDTRDVVWSYAGREGQLDGAQDRAGQVTYLEGALHLVARYAAWWRSQVDPQQPLILYDEGYNTVVPLAVGIDTRSLERALASPAKQSDAR